MPAVAAAAVAIAFSLDATVGELPTRLHPVAWFGRLVDVVDRPWRRPRLAGVLAAAALPLVGALAVGGAVTLVAFEPLAAATLAGLAVYTATSRRMLVREAAAVVGSSEADPAAARARLPALVGRDPGQLTPGQVRSAAVESAAENLADGLVAPVLAFAALAPWSLPVAAGACAWIKGVNTMDSMLGYPGQPVGWASARLDDLVMWLPARLTAALLAIAARDPGAVVRAHRWAHAPPSPNSGWPMATLAAVLGTRLEKPDTYVLAPAFDLPSVEEARRGVRLVGATGVLAYAGAGVLAWC